MPWHFTLNLLVIKTYAQASNYHMQAVHLFSEFVLNSLMIFLIICSLGIATDHWRERDFEASVNAYVLRNAVNPNKELLKIVTEALQPNFEPASVVSVTRSCIYVD